MELNIQRNLTIPTTIPVEQTIKNYLRFDINGICIGIGSSLDDTLPSDAVWCSEQETLLWQNASLIGGSISFK